ncbi:MAG: indole-3-glycerol phosphate synthase TrpC [Elusimicrobiota bacterium]
MEFLEEIREHKERLLDKKAVPLSVLKEKAAGFHVKGLFNNALKKSNMGLIAEIKMSSPSKGEISQYSVRDLAAVYRDTDADAVSVLTEEKFFKGSIDNIKTVKSICSKPVLMKDFIISEYQIYEGAAAGADAVLLIAALLSHTELEDLLGVCREAGVSALLEVHSEDELKRCVGLEGLEIVGVNCRNLKTLEIDSSIHTEAAGMIPPNLVKVAESGIDSALRVKELGDAGYDAVLVGEAIVASDDPAAKIRELKGS